MSWNQPMNPEGSNPRAFIDANVPMYAAGEEHPLREPSIRVMQIITARPHRFLTDAEVFQEIIHRYVSVRRWPHGRQVFNEFVETMHGRIEPVYAEDVVHAAALADHHGNVSSRDLLHAAVALRLGVSHIISTDTDFDRLPVVTRLAPERIDGWAGALFA
ncbi:MAG: type II toxin-antitoxin system VapC family toxin [Chloroflexi bacterium]|nr:type II toxin-antitoxin system VapC family toxin [Chloroflexota bacterium]